MVCCAYYPLLAQQIFVLQKVDVQHEFLLHKKVVIRATNHLNLQRNIVARQVARKMFPRITGPSDSNDQKQVADQRFSLKQWFSGVLSLAGSENLVVVSSLPCSRLLCRHATLLGDDTTRLQERYTRNTCSTHLSFASKALSYFKPRHALTPKKILERFSIECQK